MIFDSKAMPKVLQLYLEISQYPILAKRIRQRMREEIFARGVVSPQVFEDEVRKLATHSQRHEGLIDPLVQEPEDIWQERMDRIRDSHTDFYFAYNLPHDLFRQIVQELVQQRSPDHQVILSFNPEMAPWDLLMAQGVAYENYPPERRGEVEHHLREIRVVLIKAMMSDQLSLVRVARKYFTISDLQTIRSRRIGRGKIGGKAAGMLLAYKILQHEGRACGLDVERCLTIPESWYLASDVYYDFHTSNDLFRFMNQKYKQTSQMFADYPKAYKAYLDSHLPEYVQHQLAELLEEIGKSPLIVRSSSLLEDNFDTSFAGKYDSFFLPNQGTPEENLNDLLNAIVRVYASVIRPEALIYREQMGLTDYDERMAVLIQKVEGQQHGRYFFPDFAGVGFSYNPYRWNERIRPEDGLLRMVAGLGTRAVDRVGRDYPRMVALSHPTLRPERGPHMLRQYSQHRLDVIDLDENVVKTLPATEILNISYPALGSVASLDRGDFIQPMNSRPLSLDSEELIITFDRLLADKQFIQLVTDVLGILQEAYGRPVDIEFAGQVITAYPKQDVHFSLVQCRPLSQRQDSRVIDLPKNIPTEDKLFTANRQIPHGAVEGIQYVVYVDPHAYDRIPDPELRIELGQVVSRINQAFEKKSYILMGPGRWGTSNIQLGVKVTYADIYNTAMLVEVAYFGEGGTRPEISYGTHFFQDLVEANIYPLPLYPDDPTIIYNEDFFAEAANQLSTLLPEDARFEPYIKVIDIPAATGGRTLTIIMNSEEERAIAYFTDQKL